MPGDESRARSVIVTARKAGLWSYGKGGPRGRNAAFMTLTDFPTAICAVLHYGAATRVDEAIQRMWALPLSGITVDRSGVDGGEFWIDPDTVFSFKETLTPYLALFRLEGALNGLSEHPAMRVGSNLIGVMTSLFDSFAAHQDFGRYDEVYLEAVGEKLSVTVSLHGPKHGTQPDGWPGEGIEAGALHLTFGDRVAFDGRAVRTTRSIGADALNELSLMAPNCTKNAEAERD